MSLKKLKRIIDEQFAPPFLDKGAVVASWRSGGKLLNIKIGRRDIDVTEGGEVVGAGTTLTIDKEIDQEIDWCENAEHGATQERHAHIAKLLRLIHRQPILCSR